MVKKEKGLKDKSESEKVFVGNGVLKCKSCGRYLPSPLFSKDSLTCRLCKGEVG